MHSTREAGWIIQFKYLLLYSYIFPGFAKLRFDSKSVPLKLLVLLLSFLLILKNYICSLTETYILYHSLLPSKIFSLQVS